LAADAGLPTGQGITVAVIDTGIDYNHPDLAGRVVGGTSYVPPNYTDYMDEVGHGTMIAGVIAATDNGNGIVGMAPRVSLLAVKYNPIYPLSSVIQGIYWSVDNGARIISLSLGFNVSNQLLFNAVKYAYQQGALVIAASGNENEHFIRYPAKYDQYVVAVGATDQNDQRWVDPPAGSNYGPEMDFAAPGQFIYTTDLNGTYITENGTSLSTPHVSGIVALFWSSKVYPPYDSDGDRLWDNFEVEQKMRDTALNLHGSGRGEDIGYGLINAWYADQRPPADITYDLRVDSQDVAFLNAHWHDPPWYIGDYNRRADIDIDNRVNLRDLGIVKQNYGKIDP
jgi:subtilisin family serine protease